MSGSDKIVHLGKYQPGAARHEEGAQKSGCRSALALAVRAVVS